MRPAPSGINLTLLALILANLLPVIGVLVWDWNMFEIVALYWFENVVIGAVNVMKIITCKPAETDDRFATNLQKGALVPFFTFHYGFFCFGHGIFVFSMFGETGGALNTSGNPLEGMLAMLAYMFQSSGIIFVAAIIGSHLFSFFRNYLGEGEFSRCTPQELMSAPYGRIIALHIAIIAGGFAIEATGGKIWMLLILVIGKIIIDAKLHLRSHRKLKN